MMSVIYFIVSSIIEFMGSSRYFFLFPLGSAFILIFCTTGRKRWIACGIFASMLLGPVIILSDYHILSKRGLAWTTWVSLWSVALFFFGEIALLVWGGMSLWKRSASWEIFVRWISRGAALTGIVFLCLAFLSLSLLYLGSGMYGLNGRVDEINGQKVIWVYDEHAYYAYYGPFIRGKMSLDLE